MSQMTVNTNMDHELDRLYSFLSCVTAVQPCRLSRLGFYYSGVSDKVVCYQCGVVFEGWTTVDEVLEHHRQKSPICAEGSSADSTNKSTARVNIAGADSANMKHEFCRLNTFRGFATAVEPCRLSRIGFCYSGVNDKVVCYNCGVGVEGWKAVDEVLERHQQESPFCVEGSPTDCHKFTTARVGTQLTPPVSCRVADEIDNPLHGSQSTSSTASDAGTGSNCQTARSVELETIDRSNPNFELLRAVSTRLETFRDWPSTAILIVEPRDLAKAGLFYTGQIDRVQCAFCRGFLRTWSRGDKPMEEHSKYFPDCPFVRSIASRRTNETPAVSSSSATLTQLTTNEHTVNCAESHKSAVTGSQRNNAVHPEFTDFKTRVESFTGKRVGQGQTAEGLSAAGLFHVGPDDNVRCFYCDGGLKNWEPTDDPWTEHCRWFPQCPYVVSQKDGKFIQTAAFVRNNVA